MKLIILLIMLTVNVYCGTAYSYGKIKHITWSKCDYVYCDKGGNYIHRGDCKYCNQKIDKQIKLQERIIKLLEKENK